VIDLFPERADTGNDVRVVLKHSNYSLDVMWPVWYGLCW